MICFPFNHVYLMSLRRLTLIKVMSSKPLNILVLTENNCQKAFKNVEKSISKCVSSSKYLMYPLLDSEIETQPWIESTQLLVISSMMVDENKCDLLKKYLEQSGKILLICSKLKKLAGLKCIDQPNDSETLIKIKHKNIGEIEILRGKYGYDLDNSEILFEDIQGKPIVQKTSMLRGTLIASEIYFERDYMFLKNSIETVPFYEENRHILLKHILTEHLSMEPICDTTEEDLSHGYYICKYEKSTEKESALFSKLTLEFREENVNIDIFYYDKNLHQIPFNIELYYSVLNTDALGQNLIYFPATTSTMDIAEKLPLCEKNYVIIASKQLQGKGRGSNKWISPSGCAAFTLCFAIDFYSNLGQKLSLIQHMAALAFVYGIRNQEPLKELNLKIKWPNDIYYDRFKIGGLLVTSSLEGKIARIKIGWGINVSNGNPTVCLNDAIKVHNERNTNKMPYLQVEEVVALTVSKMEYLIKNFQKMGPGEFLSLYYSYWMHTNQEVTIQQSNETGVITGLDDYGFLKIRNSTGQEMAVQPDGNRFDITKNLIYLK